MGFTAKSQGMLYLFDNYLVYREKNKDEHKKVSLKEITKLKENDKLVRGYSLDITVAGKTYEFEFKKGEMAPFSEALRHQMDGWGSVAKLLNSKSE